MLLLLVTLFCGSLALYSFVAATGNKLCKWLLYFCLLTMQFTALHFHVSEDSRRKSKINISQSRLLVSFMKYATNINLISTLISISTMTLSGVSSRAFFFSFSLDFLCEPSYWVNVLVSSPNERKQRSETKEFLCNLRLKFIDIIIWLELRSFFRKSLQIEIFDDFSLFFTTKIFANLDGSVNSPCLAFPER